jgi:2-polyprenyl-3-methyl-5-hydroxy-6-metoxy-1,4-benzoquinol methylase
MNQKDLAGVNHWDSIYETSAAPPKAWKPHSHLELALEHVLLREIKRSRATSLLEVGCGNSTWLPYLARKAGIEVAGMDYSEHGCEQARTNLRSEDVPGKIFCIDLFKATPECIGQYDFVFSLGLVEHFNDLPGVLAKLAEFVRPGGTLFTEVPNLHWSIHGLLCWIWQPKLLAKHRLLNKTQLVKAHEQVGLLKVRAQYLGLFSLGIIAWPIYHRWPRLCSKLLPHMIFFQKRIDRLMRRSNIYVGIQPLAPYLCVIGNK